MERRDWRVVYHDYIFFQMKLSKQEKCRNPPFLTRRKRLLRRLKRALGFVFKPKLDNDSASAVITNYDDFSIFIPQTSLFPGKITFISSITLFSLNEESKIGSAEHKVNIFSYVIHGWGIRRQRFVIMNLHPIVPRSTSLQPFSQFSAPGNF